MTASGWFVCAIIAGAAYLGATGRADVDVVGALIWLALAIGRVLPLPTLLAGFGSDAVLLVASMMAVAEAFRQVGAAEHLGRWLVRSAGTGERRARFVIALTGSLLAALIESTAATVGLLPMVARLGRSGHHRPQRLYLMAALGTMAGGMLTLVGTSGNVVANGVLASLGQPTFGYLELGRLGACVVAVAMLYALTVAGRLLPRPSGVALDEAIAALRAYAAEIRIPPGSPLDGRTLREAALRAERGVDVLAVVRGGERLPDPGPEERLRAGDTLVVIGPAEAVAGLQVAPDEDALGPTAEGLIPPDSPWVGRTLARLRMRGAGLRVLGIWRHGQTLRGALADQRLRAGDVLLARGERAALAGLQTAGNIAWLNPVDSPDLPGRSGARRIAVALAVLAAFVGAAATGRVDLGLAGFGAAVAMVIGGCLDARQGYAAIQWKVLVLLAGVIPLGDAMSRTGVAGEIARGLLVLAHHWGTTAALAGLCVVATALTQVLSNVATAAVMTPVAVQLALGSSLAVKACVAAVLLSVLCTPLTPMASKPTILVQETGGYRLADYLRLGLPFSLCCLAVAVLVAPLLWPT